MNQSRGQFLATVIHNVPLCRDHFRLVIQLTAFPPTRAGQFVQLLCRPVEDGASVDREVDWNDGQPPTFAGLDLLAPTAVLRRPFSLAGRRDIGDSSVNVSQLEVIHRVVGLGTDWLSRLRVGDQVGVLGPLGNRFQPPGRDQIAILVGGGVGIPPMLYLASELVGQRAIAFCGATTRDLLSLTITADAPPPGNESIDPLYNIAEFARHGIPAVISTDDGSYGYRGFVTQSLERYLDKFDVRGAMAVIYVCGPEVMMKRVADIAIARDIPCQVAVERAMACGMGTCQSCCIKVKKPDPAMAPLPGSDWCYRLACTDGPVFEAGQLLW